MTFTAKACEIVILQELEGCDKEAMGFKQCSIMQCVYNTISLF